MIGFFMAYMVDALTFLDVVGSGNGDVFVVDVGILCDLVPQLATHDSLIPSFG